ncbi:MAG: Nif3-like dinuclear metal center hexameric protein, partial [Pirellulaceae bacterium]|nr:Nif3-like dinuclear metal center hexameric protein [Pirellulaceae bacterium]
MTTIQDVCRFLEDFAPLRLAEDWDNVGLLVGDAARPARRIMTCLTVTPDSAEEAVGERADLVVSHHPLPFRPLKRLTADHVPGRLLLQLIQAGVAVHSPHTAFDSAARGINQRLAEGLGLGDIRPLEPLADDPALGAGRYGHWSEPRPLREVASAVQAWLRLDGLHCVTAGGGLVQR